MTTTPTREASNMTTRSAVTAVQPIAGNWRITSDVRMDQILDDEDHKHSVTNSQRTLMAQTLSSLSALQKDIIQKDNWKYEGQTTNNNRSGTSNSHGGIHNHAAATTATSVSEHLL
jgi:hypothetical protein